MTTCGVPIIAASSVAVPDVIIAMLTCGNRCCKGSSEIVTFAIPFRKALYRVGLKPGTLLSKNLYCGDLRINALRTGIMLLISCARLPGAISIEFC